MHLRQPAGRPRPTALHQRLSCLAQLTLFSLLFLIPLALPLAAASRFTHLDENPVFHPGLTFPKLTTPQWIGEPDVDAVVVLAIDDLRSPEKYETYFRPILERLKRIDGRAPLSIFCNALSTENPQFQTWLKEGLSLEVHTLSHPCPLLANGNFQAAADTYFGGIELLNRIPGNRPVAYRMPCCDSMSSPSPRFFKELFPRANSQGQFLVIDSSIMNRFTTNDTSIPGRLLLDSRGINRFEKYLPLQTNAQTRVSMDGFQTLIEDYPYPYIVGGAGWEFPCVIPSDWEAQNFQGVNNPATIEDWKAAIDITVLKQGVFNLIFHPHGWIDSKQVVDWIDYVVSKHGRRVKFLTFREAADRLQANLLSGTPLRGPNGTDNGVRLADLNNDGWMDVMIGNDSTRRTRIWSNTNRTWLESSFPHPFVTSAAGKSTGLRLGAPVKPGNPVLVQLAESSRRAWLFDGREWSNSPAFLRGLELDGTAISSLKDGRDQGLRFRDLDGNGKDELFISNPDQSGAWFWNEETTRWQKLGFRIPPTTPLVNQEGEDGALRFVDLNLDGHEDLIYSDTGRFSVDLFIATPRPNLGWERGWTFNAQRGEQTTNSPVPSFVRDGPFRDNGAWFREGHLWFQNEDTANLPGRVARRSFASLITGAESAPRSVTEALQSFELAEGFQIECVAHEPMVIDPVAMEWDEKLRLWVVEMRDYPSGLDGHGKPGGVLKVLEDVNGDGVYDRSTVFLEGLNFPNGVCPWRNGVLVSAAPEVFFAEDTDGDGRADRRVTLARGFVEGNQQHRVNGFVPDLDGWIHIANGDSGGRIRSELTGQEFDLRGHDLRMNPDTGAIETVAGPTQFGRRRDDWGNWFGNNNPNWLWHYHFPEREAGRNPAAAVRGLIRMTPSDVDPMRLFSASATQRRFNFPDAGSYVTSANSPTPYRDDLFGGNFRHSIFISEPAYNVVHREVLSDKGISFQSQRAEGERNREFLASKDNWFRPTMLKVGPDGALYIADMYRLIIEHPEYFPEELRKRPDIRAGEDRGRIYRVSPKNAARRHPQPFISKKPADIVQRLTSSNGWERDTAARLFLHQARSSSLASTPTPTSINKAVAILKSMAGRHQEPRVRLQALALLDSVKSAGITDVQRALKDSEPALRVAGIRIAGQQLAGATRLDRSQEKLLTEMGALAGDSSARVRFQLALSLGDINHATAGRILAKMVAAGDSDADVQTALRTATPLHLPAIWQALKDRRGAGWTDHLVFTAIATGHTQVLEQIATDLFPPTRAANSDETLAFFASMGEGVDRFGKSWPDFWKSQSPALQAALTRLAPSPERLASLLGNPNASETSRVQAILCLGREPVTSPDLIPGLARLLSPGTPPTVRTAALKRIQRSGSTAVGTALVGQWGSVASAEQSEIFKLVVERTAWLGLFMDALEAGTIAASDLTPEMRQRLQRVGSEYVRARLAKWITPTTRPAVAAMIRNVSSLEGLSSRGAGLFKQHCANCHRLRNEGAAVGPDMGTMSDKPVDTILAGILDPNAAIDARYSIFDVRTRDGREMLGILVSETTSSMVLRQAGAVEETLARSQVESIRKSSLSLMPEGFDQQLKPQDLADIIAFIRSP